MQNRPDTETIGAIRDILGYITFSSGADEPHFWSAWNRLYSFLEQSNPEQSKTDRIKSSEKSNDSSSTDKTVNTSGNLSQLAYPVLMEHLAELSQKDETFHDCEHTKKILHLTCFELEIGYREFHKDLLFFQNNLAENLIFNPFFMAKSCATIIRIMKEITTDQEIVQEAIHQLNDFLGHRPIPVLEDETKHEPNPHEWVATVPLYRKGAGIACGPYQHIVEQTLKIITETDPKLLNDAWFDPEKLEELAMDPRTYDFDHPVNRRPNYSFGTWDPNSIDEQGYFKRFVVHRITLEGIQERTTRMIIAPPDLNAIPQSALVWEGGAVLAGTMLMGSGITGDHVQAHDSTVTLSWLMSHIAAYRDRFYDLLIKRVPETFRVRLEFEAKRIFQPFGGARQDLNKYMAKKRADQLQRSHLSRAYARMGYYEPAQEQAAMIDVGSARFLSSIDCAIYKSHQLTDRKQLRPAAEILPEIEALLHRGIACGALPDPWTILGFGAEYALFQSAENVIHDHRIDDLITLMNDVFDLYSRIQKEAAASGDSDLQADLSDRMSSLASWWDQFGSTEISGLEGFSGLDAWESAAKVSTALAAWHRATGAAGDVSFWRRHVERFSSPKAFVLLAEALLEQNDLRSAMALLMHWLNESQQIPLVEGDYSFHSITLRWMEQLWQPTPDNTDSSPPEKTGRQRKKKKEAESSNLSATQIKDRWLMAINFLDRLEANADIYWTVPQLEISPAHFERPATDETGEKKVGQLFGPPPGERGNLPLDEYVQQIYTAALTGSDDETITELCKALSSKLPGMEAIFNAIELKASPGTPSYFHYIVQLGHSFGMLRFHEESGRLLDPRGATGLLIKYLPSIFPEVFRPNHNSIADQPEDETSFDWKKYQPVLQELMDALSHDSMLQQYQAEIESPEDNPKKRSVTESVKEDDPTSKPSDRYISTEIIDYLNRLLLEKNGGEAKQFSTSEGELSVSSSFDDSSGSDNGDDLTDEPLIDDAIFDLDSLTEDDEIEDDLRGIDPLYRAAYEEMTFRDSAADGIDDDVADSGPSRFSDGDDFELNLETERINSRMAFIFTMVRLWKYNSGKAWTFPKELADELNIGESLLSWLEIIRNYQNDLYKLLEQISQYRIPAPRGTAASLMEYDQHRGTKEILLDRVIWSIVEVNDTILFMESLLSVPIQFEIDTSQPRWLIRVRQIFSALMRGDTKFIKQRWLSTLRYLENETLLYIPTSRGGNPLDIVHCRCLQQIILRFFEYLPRYGLIRELYALLEAVKRMERIRPDFPGAITEFDRIFETATRSVAQAVTTSSQHWRIRKNKEGGTGKEIKGEPPGNEEYLVKYTEEAVDLLLGTWLKHSRHIRISSIESIMNSTPWDGIRSFITEYGEDLFTQQFLNFRNIRAILHQGILNYLEALLDRKENEQEIEAGEHLLNDIQSGKIDKFQVASQLELILECVAENYSEYIDYNSTTTQSDHGSKLYILLDMLRVVTGYERISWNLKPVYWVHDIIVRDNLLKAARLWESSIAKKSARHAEEYLRHYNRLNSMYGIWLPSVHERLQERFVRPLHIDQMRAMVLPAVRDARRGNRDSGTFAQLAKQIETFARTPMGVGFEIPQWLSALQEELLEIQIDDKGNDVNKEIDHFGTAEMIPQIRLNRTQLEKEIKAVRDGNLFDYDWERIRILQYIEN